MNEYDFIKINDKEFEAVSIDLLSKVERIRIERFKPGKDGGVDGRFFTDESSEVIIQCKHWERSGLSSLMRHLKLKEYKKIKALHPRRYILVTSVELSRKNKTDIRDLLSPFVLSESDIYGREDVSDLLGIYKDVEEKHYKLWITSTNVIRLLLNNAVVGRSLFKVEEINSSSSKYVCTKNHERALKKLEKLHSAIITGEPGIGKSTLADQLCLNYLADGYELCYIESSISEAEEMFKRDKKQIFYFDDFLGRNYLQALKRHEDSHVLNFMKRISKDKDKRFILTSRSTILNQGKRLSDLYRIENIDKNEYEIKIQSISNLEKAKILYNHIWFGHMGNEFIDELYTDKRYKSIVKHDNYNPRLISFVTDAHKMSGISVSNYWEYVVNTLDNPADTWGHVYDNQLDEKSRLILCLVVFNGVAIAEVDLKQSYVDLCKGDFFNLSPAEESDFYSTIKLSVGAVLNRKILGLSDQVKYDLFNPAVGDYVLQRFSCDLDRIFHIFNSLTTIESLDNLKSLLESGCISNNIFLEVISRLANAHLDEKVQMKGAGYKIHLSSLISSIDGVSDDLKRVVSHFIYRQEIHVLDSVEVCEITKINFWCVKNGLLASSGVYYDLLINNHLSFPDLVHEDFVALGALLSILGEPLIGKYSGKVREKASEYWSQNIGHDVIEHDVLGGFFDDDDESEACDAVWNHVNEILYEYYVGFDDDYIQYIVEDFDVMQHIDDNRTNSGWQENENRGVRGGGRGEDLNEDIAIDDLFQRQ